MNAENNHESPSLEYLLRRLLECPPDFLLDAWIQGRGVIRVPALVSDLMRDFGEEPLLPGEAEFFEPSGEPDRNRAQLIMIVIWLLHDPWFLSQPQFALKVYSVLGYGLTEISSVVEAEKFVTDPDRREELVRYCLSVLGILPMGETAAQAHDRLTTLSSVYREQVMQESRSVQDKVRQLREILQKKIAAEAAAKVTRE